MFDDFHGRLLRILATRQAALWPLARISQRMKVTGVAKYGGAHADADACFIHHLEHMSETLVRLAHQFGISASLLAEIEHAICRAPESHLVIQSGKRDIVAARQRAIIV